MSSQYNTSTDISNLLVQFFERKALKESLFNNGLTKYGQDAVIPEGNSATINWHRWNKFALASDLTEGSQGTPASGKAMDTTQVTATLVEFGDFVRIPLFADAIRLDSAAKQSYIKFTEQASRTANNRITTKLANITTGFYKMYAGVNGAYGNTLGEITNTDVQRAVNYIEKQFPPNKKVICLIDPWNKGSLMIKDKDFRDLIKFSDLDILKKNALPQWAGASIDFQDEPFREDSAGAEGTYVAAGDIVSMYIFNPEAYGKVALMGKTGLQPKWHVQNIDPTGAEMTIGYRIPFASSVLNANWGVCLKGRGADFGNVANNS